MSSETMLEQTAVQVNAFARNMQFGRLDAGLMNLEYINKIIDNEGGVNGQASQD